jgi:HEAT repeat protein
MRYDRDRGVQLRAVTALGATGTADERAFALLLAYLRGTDKGMARFAATGLAKLGDARAINPLRDTIRESWLLNSAQALIELSHDNSDAIPYLLAVLEDEHMEARACALDALSVVGDLSVFDPAIRAYRRAEDEIRWRAVAAIDRIDGDRALPYLISALADSHPDTRLVTAQILGWRGERGEARAIEPLVQMLEGVDSNVQLFAANSLGGIGDSRALPALKRLRDAYVDEIETDDTAKRITNTAMCAITLIEMQQVVRSEVMDDSRRS